MGAIHLVSGLRKPEDMSLRPAWTTKQKRLKKQKKKKKKRNLKMRKF
jgi:hypothetical protein